MARSFEEMEVWRTARELVKLVYDITMKPQFCKDYSLVEQIRRASVSAMSNIVEGFERGLNTEFIQFLYIAKGSAGEVRTQLYVALDQGYIANDDFKTGNKLCIDIASQISGFIKYLKRSKLKGGKFTL